MSSARSARTTLATAKRAVTAILVAGTLLVLILAGAGGGCSSGETNGTATTTSGTSVGPSTTVGPATTVAQTTTTLPQVLTDWDIQLAETAQVENQLAAYLTEQGAAQDDPRLAIIYGLRARVQAITGRQALDKGDLELADTAMRDVYSTLNLGRNAAEGSVSQTLEDAYAIIATLGIPSDKPEEASTLLDQFIAGLSPLLDEAKALIPAG
jgi:hypothetical protein